MSKLGDCFTGGGLGISMVFLYSKKVVSLAEVEP